MDRTKEGAPLEIRELRDGDIPAVHAIYAASVIRESASWEYDPPDAGEIRRRAEAVLSRGYPYFVAIADGKLAGYAYAGEYRTRAGYRYTVENSVYVDPAFQRRGIAKGLMERLIEACTERGYRQMVAMITGPDNPASVRLHLALGFAAAGVLPGIGWKHGQWLDLVVMVKPLGTGNRTPPQ